MWGMNEWVGGKEGEARGMRKPHPRNTGRVARLQAAPVEAAHDGDANAEVPSGRASYRARV